MTLFEEFRPKVFAVIKTIPSGKVMSYKQVAKIAGISNPRFVGRILNSNTNPKEYPCHRVIKSDGTVAKGYAFGGPDKQIEKLEKEGVRFNRTKVSKDSFFTFYSGNRPEVLL